MTKLLKTGMAMLLVAAMSVVAGCAAVPSGGGDSALVGDLLTERSVLRALYAEPDLTGAPISVGCVDGIVTLTGTVKSELERSLAERIAKGVDGVTAVQNNLITSS